MTVATPSLRLRSDILALVAAALVCVAGFTAAVIVESAESAAVATASGYAYHG